MVVNGLNLFQATINLTYTLNLYQKISFFSDVFSASRKGALARNGLSRISHKTLGANESRSAR